MRNWTNIHILNGNHFSNKLSFLIYGQQFIIWKRYPVIYIPKGSLEAYSKAEGWSLFAPCFVEK